MQINPITEHKNQLFWRFFNHVGEGCHHHSNQNQSFYTKTVLHDLERFSRERKTTNL